MIVGYTRHLATEFEAYNAQALERIQSANPDPSMDRYTNSIPDINPNYVWAIEDPIFTNLMTEVELSTILSKENAILAGMQTQME